MYTPAHFSETRTDVLHGIIREFPLASLISVTGGDVECSHVPLFLDAEHNVLRGHVARANPHWQSLDGSAALAIFHGPDHYVTPSWYASKQKDGKVVPTWNYVVVHARGRMRVVEDADFLMRTVSEMTTQEEAAFADPWAVADAPVEFIEGMTRSIVGLELAITRLEGKRKLSQNRSELDRKGVRDGLDALGSERSAALRRAMQD